MNRASIRWARVAAMAVAAVSLVGIGCDEVSDPKATRLMTEAAAVQAVGGGVGAVKEGGETNIVEKNLNEFAAADRHTLSTVQGQHALGVYQTKKADHDAAQLIELIARADALLSRIGVLSGQAQTGQTLATNYRQLDPTTVVQQVSATAEQAKGSGNAASFEVVPGTSIQTLANAQQIKSKLDGDIAKLNDQIAAVTKQRDDLLATAGKESAAQESLSGTQRVESVKRAADARQQAAVLSRQISDQTSQLQRLQADAAVQDALVQQLSGTVETLSGQVTALNSGWKGISEQADAQTAQAKGILDGSGPKAGTVESVKSLTAQLNDVLKQIADARDAVTKQYDSAITTLTGAKDKASALATEINSAKSNAGDAFETKAWSEQLSLLAVDRINLDKAAAERGLAAVHTMNAALLTQMASVAKSVEAAAKALKVQASAPFDSGKIAGELNAAIGEADKQFQAVDDTLEGINLASNDLANLKPARATAKILGLYEHALLCRLAALGGVGGALPEKAPKLIESAKAAVEDAQANNYALPTLPDEIRVAKKAPPTPPAEGETTPATPPAEGTTPATPPAEGTTPATPPADGATPPATGGETPATPAEPAPADNSGGNKPEAIITPTPGAGAAGVALPGAGMP